MVVHACNPSTLGGRGRWISDFEASLVYRVSYRTTRAIQRRNPVSKKPKLKQNKTKQNKTKKQKTKTKNKKKKERNLKLHLLPRIYKAVIYYLTDLLKVNLG